MEVGKATGLQSLKSCGMEVTVFTQNSHMGRDGAHRERHRLHRNVRTFYETLLTKNGMGTLWVRRTEDSTR